VNTKTLALIALFASACTDNDGPLTSEMIDCNKPGVFSGAMFSKCSPACVDFPSYVNPPGAELRECKSAYFAGSGVPAMIPRGLSSWHKGEDGSDRYGACIDTSISSIAVGATVPAGEVRFYECDRSEWPAR